MPLAPKQVRTIGQNIGRLACERHRRRILSCSTPPDEHAADRWEAAKADAKAFEPMRRKLYIDGFFLSIVSIICLLVLFSELGR